MSQKPTAGFKHLDNIYFKFGVHTSTAAAALVRELQLHSRGTDSE